MKANQHLQEEQIIPYLDGRLAASERGEVARHLESCGECRTQLAELRRLLAVLEEWRAVEPSASFAAALQRRLERAAHPASSWWARLHVRPIYAGALAVVLLAVVLIGLWSPSPPEMVTTTQVPSLEVEALGGEDLAELEPVLLENYELLREFDILFEAQPAGEKEKKL